MSLSIVKLWLHRGDYKKKKNRLQAVAFQHNFEHMGTNKHKDCIVYTVKYSYTWGAEPEWFHYNVKYKKKKKKNSDP